MASTVAQSISFYGYILTSPLGFLGHACSLITFFAKPLRLTSTALLFICLTMVDIIYLSISIYDFLALTIRVQVLVNFSLCRFRLFMLYCLATIAAWILGLIALDRLIRTRFPFQQARICTRKVAAFAVVVVIVCSVAFTYHLLTPEVNFIIPGTNICQPNRYLPTTYTFFYYQIWPILQILITYLIPSVLMILSVIGISTKIRAQRNRIGALNHRKQLHRQMLILMLSSIVCFIICTWPFSILLIVSSRHGTSSPNSIETFILIIFLNIHYSYNFYIHCLTSRLFRKTFFEQLTRFYRWIIRSKNANAVHCLPTIERQ